MKQKLPLSMRAQSISPFYVMDILARARQLQAEGHDVVHLEVGEPDFDTPESVREAAKRAIDERRTFYTPATGLPQLREAIASYYQQQLSASVSSRRVVVTPGASGALQLALSVLVDPGQKVMMADPGYPCNRHFVRMLEGKTNSVNVGAGSEYQLTHEMIEAHWDEQTVAVMIASPSNPTGTLIERDEMQRIIQTVSRLGGVLLVDEIYQGLVYGQDDFTAAEFSQDIFVINSFSKFFSMTGWRLGWLLVPEEYYDAVDRLAQNLFLAPPTVSQYAALEAFSEQNLQLLYSQRNKLEHRRDYLLQGLKALGFDIKVEPRGAFYIYADVSAFTNDSFEFCQQLLERAHVAITPGIDFGEYNASRYVRFAYTQNEEKLQLALDRIRLFLSSYEIK